MNFSHRLIGEIVVFEPVGEMDMDELSSLKSFIASNLKKDSGTRGVILNMGKMRILPSMAIAMIIVLSNLAKENEKGFQLSDLSKHVKNAMTLVGMDYFLNLDMTEQDALGVLMPETGIAVG